MSCKITKGRLEVCKESIGGIQAIYIENWEDRAELGYNVNGEVSGFTTAPDLFVYELKGANTFVETINTSRDNGTTFFTQTLTINLKKLSNEMTTQLKVLAAGRVRIWIHTNNGETLLMGLYRGADLTAGSSMTGGVLGDMYGYSGLVFTAEEKDPAKFVAGSTVTDPFYAFVMKPILITE